MNDIKQQQQLNLMNATMDMENYRTSHLLHFVFTFLTGGIWLIGWLLVAQHNGSKRNSLMKKAKKLNKKLGEIIQ